MLTTQNYRLDASYPLVVGEAGLRPVVLVMYGQHVARVARPRVAQELLIIHLLLIERVRFPWPICQVVVHYFLTNHLCYTRLCRLLSSAVLTSCLYFCWQWHDVTVKESPPPTPVPRPKLVLTEVSLCGDCCQSEEISAKCQNVVLASNKRKKLSLESPDG